MPTTSPHCWPKVAGKIFRGQSTCTHPHTFLLLASATRVTVLLLLRSCDVVSIGTEGGGVYFLQLPRLSLKEDQTLFQDQITQRWGCSSSLRGLSIRKHDLKTTFMYSERILLELLLVVRKKEKENFSYLSNHIFSAQTITLTVLCLFFIPPSHSQHVFFGNTPLFPLFSSSWWGQTHTDMLRLFSRWPQKQQAGQDHVVQGPWEDS